MVLYSWYCQSHTIDTTSIYSVNLYCIIVITDDNVSLEAVEMFKVELSLPQQNQSVIQLGDINVTTVNILDDDGMYLYNMYASEAFK